MIELMSTRTDRPLICFLDDSQSDRAGQSSCVPTSHGGTERVGFWRRKRIRWEGGILELSQELVDRVESPHKERAIAKSDSTT